MFVNYYAANRQLPSTMKPVTEECVHIKELMTIQDKTILNNPRCLQRGCKFWINPNAQVFNWWIKLSLHLKAVLCISLSVQSSKTNQAHNEGGLYLVQKACGTYYDPSYNRIHAKVLYITQQNLNYYIIDTPNAAFVDLNDKTHIMIKDWDEDIMNTH